ncbi:MAG TPA: CehA/McbA family metallohydrolase [Terriglobia bacterium]|jgi:hypothetical protein
MVGIARWSGCALLALSIIFGTISDRPYRSPHLTLGGYQVLAADFHIHSFPQSWAMLSPWDTVIEARRLGLDAIALTPHNHTWVAKAGKWFSGFSGNPIVIVGEEIHSIKYHILAIGITQTVDWRQPPNSAIDEVHRQGGIAIAAHPVARYASAYDAESLRKLDGSEVVHPLALTNEQAAGQLREFFSRGNLAAIGDSDYHLGPLAPDLGAMGICRTYVFARERSEQGILDALREKHTVVYDHDHVYGDPALIQLAAEDGRLPKLALAGRPRSALHLLSGIAGLLGLMASLGRWG